MLTTQLLCSDVREEIISVHAYLEVTRELLAGFDSELVLDVSRVSALLEPACIRLAHIAEQLE